MKVKMTVNEIDKFKVACEACDIKVLESKHYGKATVVMVSVQRAEQLYQAGLIQSDIDLSKIEEEKKVEENQPENEQPMEEVGRRRKHE